MADKDRASRSSRDDEVAQEVAWAVDVEGRYIFVEDGVTYVLATDGYAYPEQSLTEDIEVEYARQPPQGAREPAGDEPAGDEPAGNEPAGVDATEVLEPVRARRGGRRRRGRGAGRRRRGADGAAEALEADEAAPAADEAAPAVDEPTASRDQTAEVPRARVPSLEEPVTVKARAGRAEKQAGEQEAPVLLSLRDLRSGYGTLPVLHGVTVDVRRGETAVLLGLNGAGKTTTALNVCGALKAWGGTIEFDGQDITAWNTGKCVAAGVVMVPEGRRVFPDLSVEKNLQMGAWSQRRDDGWFETGRERVYDYFPRMRERASQLAGTLSGGEQQMLAIGRGLMANPKLLIIDEASMGLAPVIVQDVFDIVSQINADGVTVLLIEQNVGALDVADLGLVMEQGRMVKQLRGERLRDRSEVTEVLMG